MAVWLVRAGAQGQYEQKFLQENRIYLTWDDLNIPLDSLSERSELIFILRYVQALNPVSNFISESLFF